MSGATGQESSGVAPGAVDLTDITGYLNAEDSYNLDCELMSTPGFSLEQLMELAGLAVAEAVYAVIPPSGGGKERKKILLVCGPGNNGGDGLVAARHLTLFGYDCTVVYPKQSKSKQHFVNLVKQMEDVGVTIREEMPSDAKEGNYAAIVDAIFGFSFKAEGGIREPFGSIIKDMIASQGKGDGSGTSIISVDVPSGWDVNGGDGGTGFMPDVLISLTSPKLSSKKFTGRHFVGGRFFPPAIAEKYGVSMPPYEGVQQVWES
jgi:NAD(P)H-hydrate epimerase